MGIDTYMHISAKPGIPVTLSQNEKAYTREKVGVFGITELSMFLMSNVYLLFLEP